ncbi:TMAO reductase system periplasmic protein TorT [Aromatoleum toluvorans]|uniref:TMAO reductase system periplasmic protein TorT n=1 Tax=Aromatoleum toluvorans TaxID=92002 RepID=A0ABX1Q1J7_9RHOO|nr:TMAO reductase system periplasmic protein TorT [Aromatoleum toluvorans]NMG45572.1 TMAO reductase system periplasmic protein TorT [Aromatoleum toluvorans]
MRRIPVVIAAALLGLSGAAPLPASAAREILRRDPSADDTRPAAVAPYVPARAAAKRWTLCAAFPHIKDAYWLGVNFGMMDEARRLGVEVRLVEAGGYPNLEIQREQLKACGADPAVDAVILGTVSYDGLTDVIGEIARRIPVLATVNDIASEGISAKVGVSWYEMGRLAGEYLVRRHPGHGEEVPIAWFPGPQGAGWVPFVDRGFRDAIAGSRIAIRTTAWGDTAKSIQRNLVQGTLDSHPEVRYLVGNALMAEAAISVLRERGLQDRTDIVATYFTPAVYRGILRGRVLAAPTDAPVLQGRLSIDQAVDLLEGRPFARHVGPRVQIVDHAALKRIELGDSLPPNTFTPQFRFSPASTH